MPAWYEFGAGKKMARRCSLTGKARGGTCCLAAYEHAGHAITMSNFTYTDIGSDFALIEE